MSESLPISERLSSAYKRLVAAAEALNAASNEFSRPITEIEHALRRLNLGLITWQKMAGGEDNYGGYWSRDVGYARLKGAWCLAIRFVKGNHNWEEDDIEQWPFDEAPSSLRLEALDKIPDLIEELIKNSEKTAKKLKERTPEARDLAAAVKQASTELGQRKKERR